MLNKYRSRILLIVASLMGLGVAAPASAQGDPDGVFIAVLILGAAVKNTRGVRTGVSDSPDQYYLGVHFSGGPSDRKVRFRPYLELALGHHTTSWALNGEVAYFTRSPWQSSEIYLGVGPALNVYLIHSPEIHRRDRGAGINFVLGFARKHKGP